jgi:hypothetical protein
MMTLSELQTQQLTEALISIATGLGSAGLLLLFYPPVAAGMAMAVVIAHEYAHYFSAILQGGKPVPPYFIPLGVGVLGITWVRKLPHLSRRSRRYIIFSGPAAGMITATSLLPFAIAYGTPTLVLGVIFMLAFEIYAATFGSDGKKLRHL